MAWTLSDITALVRTLTGRPSVNQVSDSVLTNYINDYYQMAFPFEADAPELGGFYTLALADGTGEYALPTTILTVKNPMTIDDGDGDAVSPITFCQNETEFFNRWPDDTSRAEGEPTEVLLYARTLYFRPVPDAVYTFKAAKILKPTALTAGTSPTSDNWGRIIAYGAAIQYLYDNNDTEKGDSLSPMYQKLMSVLNRGSLIQISTGARITPEF